ncbi:MAG: hypothetical protein JSS04_04995 [Proteobacteria bacterium]|nr:hypothetical protein [Pseudomonadota bacterium]
MIDRLGVTKYPVAVTLPQDIRKAKVLARLATMEREAMHLATAVRDMRNGILRSDSQLFVGGVMNSRNWTLSVVLSHCYLQTLVDAGVYSSGFSSQATPSAFFQASILFQRAAEMGANDGRRDR